MNTKVTLARLEVGTVHETSEDFTLPDYLPEVRRIISCVGSVLPESKYIDRGEITTSGLVVYTVYYLGDDGSFNAVPLNSEYTAQIPCQGADLTGLSTADLLVKTTLESAGCRATGPRRLVLSGRMRTKVLSFGETEIIEKVTTSSAAGEGKADLKSELTLERHKSSVECSSVFTSSATGGVTGELREREGAKLISCSGTATVTDAKLESGVISVRGDANVSCLVMSPEGEYSTVKVKAPFEEKLPIGNKQALPEDARCSVSAVARCAAVNMSGGDGGLYSWDMEYDIDAVMNADYTAEVTDDIYSTLYETKVTEGEVNVVSCLKNGSSRLSLNTTKQIHGGEGKTVAHATGKVGVDHVDYTADGKMVLRGNCTVSAILVGGGEVSTEDVEIPYRFECDGKRTDVGVPSVMHDVCVIATDVRLDGDRMSVSAELGLSLFATAANKRAYVGEVVLDSDTEVGLRGNCVKIYFPFDDETTWDIGKRYHCEQKHIRPIEGMRSVMIAVE